MFCPECKAEYRSGFTRCSDCGVDLVDEVDARTNAAAPATDPNVAEVLWTGVDVRARGEVVRALEAANIPYHERSREVGMLPGMTQNVYGILVQAGDREAARKALQAPGLSGAIPTGVDGADADADDGLPEVGGASADDEDAADDGNDDSDYDPENFHPDDATAEVWSGADAGVRDEMVVCLEEVGIGCAVAEGAGVFHIRVMPSSAARAKEIIQQIIDAGS